MWIAGCIGITPFRSWIRAFLPEQQVEFDIDLYYTVRTEDEALFVDEINMAATQHRSFRPHIIYSGRDGPLTAEHIVDTCGGGAIVAKEVPPKQIHFEYFNFR